MNTKDFYKENISQDYAIDLLKKLKYEYLDSEKVSQLRGNLYNVLLKPILKESLNRLNSYTYKEREYKFSDKNINAAISDIDEFMIDGLIETNKKIYNSLIFGRSYTENLEDGTTRSFSMKFIDWENINNNSFYVASDIIIQSEDKRTITTPDLVLFINGIPFGVIEFKAAFISINKGIKQILSYQSKDYIPQLFKFIQIAMVTNGSEGKYSTCGTYGSYWNYWNERESEWFNSKLKECCIDRLPTNQDMNIISLFSPERVIELIKYFIIFQNGEKDICRYHHYFAVKDIINTIDTMDEHGNRQSGIIFQAPGSGKSLTMVILTRYILSAFKLLHPKVIVVTDRLDLDYQINSRFNNLGLNSFRATTVSHLRDLIYNNDINIITTTMQKFNTESVIEGNIESRNVFILIDDSNFSQSNKLNTNMKKIFPNACYLRFTSNLLFKNDSFSEKLIHFYTLDDAVNDKVTVPLLYENRIIESNIEFQLDKITRNLNHNYSSNLLKKYHSIKKSLSNNERINLIALDINSHFLNNFKSSNLPYTALLTTNSQRDAIEYLRAFEALGDLNVGLFTAMNKYDEIYILKDKLNHGELDLLIGVDRILTGFDIPQATILYIDKNMNENALLQAIARINRPYKGKEYGYIIDYMGVVNNLKSMLQTYSNQVNKYSKYAVRDVISIIDNLKEDYRRLINFFNLIEDKKNNEEYEIYLADKKLREEFYKLLYKFSINFFIALEFETISNFFDKKEIEKYKSCFMFYQKLRESVKHRYSDIIYDKEYEAKIQKIFDNYISTEYVFRITDLSDILNKEGFDKEIWRIENLRSKADTIRTRLSSSILKKYYENPAYYKKFLDRIEKIFKEYNNSQISDLDYLNKIEDILKNYREKNDYIYYPDSIKTNEDAKAFYGVFADVIKKSEFSYEIKEEDLGALALKTNNIIKENIKVDWHKNMDVQNNIAQEIDDILYEYTGESGIEIPFEDIDKIIKKVINVGLNRY